MSPRLLSRPRLPLLALVLAFAGVALVPARAADTARRGQTETALDRYVAAPDPSFKWTKVAEASDGTGTAYVLDLVSQTWLTPAEVNRPEWRHWLVVIKPAELKHSTALLFISGGSNRPGNPPRPSRSLIEVARATGSVVAELRMVPNQKLVFHGDGKEREEDDLIAYTWNQYLKTGDERWPARLPMTKAAVRAMDTITAFLAAPETGGAKVDSFVVAGGSKRGWTAWTTAAVDRRVVGVAPIVIDVLNVEVSMRHHYRAYGFYAPSVGDYVSHGIMAWAGTPELAALYAIEDPFSYRDRLTLPKLVMNAGGDQFFVPDSARHFFGALSGPKHLRTIPNTDHGLKDSDAYQTLTAWYHALLNRRPAPELTWKLDPAGTLAATTSLKPQTVLLWQAHNPAARDFRMETLGPVWKSAPVDGDGKTYAAKLEQPAAGWTASFLELSYDVGAGVPLKLTTEVFITPDTLPFAAPNEPQPKGFLQNAAAKK